MTRLLLIVFLSILSTYNIKSQGITIGFQTGLGTYSMTGLKKINANVPRQLMFDTKLVSDFPVYWYYRPSILVNFKDANFSLVYTYQSTGSRISGKDYSGEYRFDMVVSSHCPGLYSEVSLFTKNKFDLWVYITGGLVFSNLKLKEYCIVFDSVLANQTNEFEALNYYVEPGLNIKYTIKPFAIGFNAGYFITIGEEAFYTLNNKQNKLKDSYIGSPIKPEWDGFRFGISVSYNFTYKKHEKSKSEQGQSRN